MKTPMQSGGPQNGYRSLRVTPVSSTQIKKANWYNTRKSAKIKTAGYGLASNLLRSAWHEPGNNALIDAAESSLL